MQQTLRWILTLLLLTLSAYVSYGQVTAGFTASPMAGCAPLIVSFTNTSTPAGGTTYSWNMGNGSGPDTVTNPSTSYLASGTYTVTLTATHGGTTSTYSQVITVYPTPTISFNVNDTAVCPGVPLTFTSTSTANVPGGMTYLWSFGDGFTATTNPAVHAIGLPGYFNITLKATNADGCSSILTKTAYVHIYTPPDPLFTVSSTHICPHTSVSFTPAPIGKPPFTYLWSFGDGSPTTTSTSPTHLYASPGTYIATLTVTDGNGCEDSASVSILETNVASFTTGDTVCIGLLDNFINTTTTRFISDEWLYSGGTSTGVNAILSFDSGGYHTVSLVTYDGYCYDTVSHNTYVIPPPTGFTITPATPCPAPVTATFTGSNVPPGATVTWMFDDVATGSGNPATHVYTVNAMDTVQMFTSYGPGCRDTLTQVYKIYDLVFGEFHLGPGSGCIPLSVQFAASAQTSFIYPYVKFPPPPYPYPYTPFVYTWNFGDGSPSVTVDSIPDISHTYTAVGVYTITLTAISANGCVEVRTDSVRAGTPSQISISDSTKEECYRDNAFNFYWKLISGTPNSISWNWNDGSTPTLETVSDTATVGNEGHNFVGPGTYVINVTPLYNGCPGPTLKDTVIVDSPGAVDKFTVTCSPPNTFLAQDISLASDETCFWKLSDGFTSTLASFTHTFPSSGVYNGYLAEYNPRTGCRDTDFFYVDQNRQSFNVMAEDTALCKGDSTTIKLIINSGSVLAFAWYIDNILIFTANPDSFVYVFNTPGRYTVGVTLIDGNDCGDTITRVNYILAAQPVGGFTVTQPSVCWPADSVTFTDENTDQPGTFLTHYYWAMGDSTTDSVTVPSISHVYRAPGGYKVTETATDNLGCTNTFSDSIHFYKQTASFTTSANHVCAYTNVYFTNTSLPLGSASYSWTFGDGTTSSDTNGVHEYSDTGSYNVLLVMTNPHGCTDSASTRIHVTKPYAAFYMDDSTGICQPFTVHFTNLGAGGTNSWLLLNSGGASPATNPVFVYTTPGYDTVTLIVTDSAGCKDSAVGHVKIYGYTGAFSYTPDSGCAPLTILFNANLTNIAAATSIAWDFSDGVVMTSPGDSIYHTYAAGSYVPKLIIEDTTGCKDTTLGSVIRVDGVKAGFRANPNPACPGDTVLLTDTSSSYWGYIVGHGWTYNGVSDTLATTSMSDSVSGVYSVTLQDVDNWGCTASVIETVTVTPLPNAGNITLNMVNGFCIGDTVTVNDTVAGGTWRFSNGDISITGNTITGMAPGTDTLYYTVTNQCGTAVAIDTFHVLPPLPPIAGVAYVCPGDTTMLSDSMTGGTWQGGDAHVAVFSNVQDSGIVVGVSAGTAVVTYQMDLGCRTTTTITVNPAPAISNVIAPIKCYNDSNGSIVVTPDSVNAPYHYLWSSGAVAPSISNLKAGAYMLRVNDTVLQCVLLDTFQVTMPDSIQMADSINNDVCFSPNGSIEVYITGGTSPYHYLWSDKTTGSGISGLTSGKYSLVLTDFNGCIENYDFLLTDTGCPYIIIHNAISPNGDGINETWVIEHIQEFPKNTVYVFDKWGDEIFKQDDYSNYWYGLAKNGKPVPDGTYYYLIKLNTDDVTGGKNTFTGTLLIKR